MSSVGGSTCQTAELGTSDGSEFVPAAEITTVVSSLHGGKAAGVDAKCLSGKHLLSLVWHG